MINVIDQLFEHYNQNHSKILIIGYLKLNIKKFQSLSRKSQRSITRTRNIGTNEQHLSIKNDKDSSIISNTNKDTKVNFERLLSTTVFSIKSVVSLISTQDLLKNLEEILNYFKSTFNVQKSGHELETHALATLEPVVYDLFLVETLLELVRYNKNLFISSLRIKKSNNRIDIFINFAIVDSVRNEDPILTRWNNTLSLVNRIRDSDAPLRILHDLNNVEKIPNDFRQSLVHD
ncbi:unnamed protein product [Rotaria sordida]|uniref:Uncharacterized protein n=1 Tax=Rotaria sordida TaxID=392033 RepID=A0A816BTE7_9BILA|nr:unnamed protein product [Rotaria sordida]CAF1611717.1 unnamed protein product [Rotaria sordida]